MNTYLPKEQMMILQIAQQTQLTKRMKKICRGFSIIEIVLVITIIGILAAATFGGFRYIQRAKLSTTNSKLATLDLAIDHYNTLIGEYPTDPRELIDGPSKANLQKRWQEPLATEDELNDAWKQPFVYSRLQKGYELYSMGSTGTARILSPKSLEYAGA